MHTKLRIHLSRIMGEQKLDMQGLAKRSGVEAHTISDWYYERIRRVDVATLLKLCEALGITDIRELLTIEPDHKEPTG